MALIQTAGKYMAKCVNHEHGIADSGTEQIALTFEVVEEGPEKGHILTGYVYFTEKATDRALESLENCGWDGKNLDTLDGIGTKEVQIDVSEEEYNGKRQLKVKWINKPGSGAVKSVMTPEQRADFNQRMRGEILRRQQQKSPPKSSADFAFGANAKKDRPPV